MRVLGTELYSKGFETAVTEFIEILNDERRNLLISPSDANVLVHAVENIDFRKITDDYFWHLPDGMPSVWILKLKGSKTATRIGGPKFFKRIINETKHLPINHFLCGGAEGVADQLKMECNKWGNNNISGTYCPPFKDLSNEEMQSIADLINQSNTSILWIGLGAPKQLYFSHRISKLTNVHAILPIGAAFDFHTGNVKKAPIWIENIGMEWFFRLCQEPKRLIKRYIYVVPKFVYYNLIDLFR
jgi:N-acetylglucosaminyldiphosphoundecaprenol N-acetyl-beta-D-mannosaminyltransferase